MGIRAKPDERTSQGKVLICAKGPYLGGWMASSQSLGLFSTENAGFVPFHQSPATLIPLLCPSMVIRPELNEITSRC